MLDVTEIGVGVLCTCSVGKNVPSPAGTTTFLPHPATISSDALTAEVEAQSMNHYGDRQARNIGPNLILCVVFVVWC